MTSSPALLVATALAAAATSGFAAAETSDCSVTALTAFAVARISIASATAKPDSDKGPAYCDVLGAVTTTGEAAQDGAAKFELRLPAQWNGKFLFWGVGGLAGNLTPSLTRADIYSSVEKGYAIAVTDTGHQGDGLDASWALIKPGMADDAKLADYYFRAVHQVTTATRSLTQAYFARPADRSYFDGCSNGGREALIEAERYPDDYDGIIAGAPFLDIRAILAGVKAYQRLMSPDSYIPPPLLAVVDKTILDRCDVADGVADGLIQNPAKCDVDLKPIQCRRAGAPECLSSAQAETLTDTLLAPVRDDRGQVLYPGAALGNFSDERGLGLWLVGKGAPADFDAPEPWGPESAGVAPLSWDFADQFIKFVVERDPGFDLRRFKIGAGGIVDAAALSLFDARTSAGDAHDPKTLAAFLGRQKKLLIYHGFSDPALAPYRTMMFYEALAAATPGGYPALQRNVRLFMGPGMLHCGGGSGPNSFDMLGALEKWVELGQAPDAIAAAHFPGNDAQKKPDRTMPLCPFPAAAKYNGVGDVADAANWRCDANQDLAGVGPAGATAGLPGGR
jgi:feruloyl esterase